MTAAGWEASAVLALLIGFCAGLSAAGRRWPVHPEHLRKSLHAGMGLVATTFPVWFTDERGVIGFGIAAALWFLGIRSVAFLRRHCGGALLDVSRTSFGEFHYLLGVCTLYVVTAGEPARYCAPILILALADTASAIVGTHFGRRRLHRVLAGKTVEGSAAFFFTAVTSTYLALAVVTDSTAITCAATALACGAGTTVVESVSHRGWDNLTIPIGAFALLEASTVPGVLAPMALLASMLGVLMMWSLRPDGAWPRLR